MKRNKLIKLAVILVALNTTMTIYAQKETITVSKTVEDSVDYNYKRKYEYLNHNLLENKSLLKIEGNYILFYNPNEHANYWSPGFSVNYERKVSPSFSVSGGIRTYFTYDSLTVYGLGLQGRYYYLKNKQIKNKTGADNMIGPYILFGVQNILSYRSPIPKPSDKKKEFGFSPLIQLGFGNQFYINQWMNFDFNFYTNYGTETGKFDLRIEGSINFILRGKKTK